MSGKEKYQFRRFSTYNGFCYIFPYYAKCMGKPMRFPYDNYKKKKSSNCTKSLLTVNESNIISKSNEYFAVSLHPSLYNITSLNKTPV